MSDLQLLLYFVSYRIIISSIFFKIMSVFFTGQKNCCLPVLGNSPAWIRHCRVAGNTSIHCVACEFP